MEPKHINTLKNIQSRTRLMLKAAQMGNLHCCLSLLYQLQGAIENAIAELEKLKS